MKYKLIRKNPENQPASGHYNDWKPQICEECYRQCVYCAIQDNHWGGIDNFHIDHFRPKSRAEFAHLVDDIMNLFYSCPVCNRFKSNDWPANPNVAEPSYLDPSVTDYDSIFETDEFFIHGKNVAARYIAVRLFLNRPQLIFERREATLKNQENDLFAYVLNKLPELEDKELLRKASSLLGKVKEHLNSRDKIQPYKLSEIRKK